MLIIMPHLSTLGYTPNPLINRYQNAFLEKLKNIWKVEIGWDIPPDDFLLYPDVHWLLLASVRMWSANHTDFLQEVKVQYAQYILEWWVHHIDPLEIIAGTKISLTMEFANPDIDKHTHPDHKTISMGYTEKTPWEWRKLFWDAFAIVAQVSPGFMDEINLLLRKIIPFGLSVWWHNSGSYGDVIGHIIMSYPIDIDSPEIAVLEAILHEYNHNKINLIMQTEKLILSDMREQYYSPYRPDPRHIHGIYLGIHALAGAYWVIWQAHIAGILELSPHWQEKAVLYTLKNGLSLQILDKYASLTPLGKELLEEMRSVHKECLDCIKKSNFSKEMMDRVKSALMSHYHTAKIQHPSIRS